MSGGPVHDARAYPLRERDDANFGGGGANEPRARSEQRTLAHRTLRGTLELVGRGALR